MNRRNFFLASIATLFASFLPRWLSAAAVPSTTAEGALVAGQSPDGNSIDDARNPTIVYRGDPNDENYHKVKDGQQKFREGRRLFVNGIDRTSECYECYCGENGWANLIVKTPADGGKLRTVFVAGPWVGDYSRRWSIRTGVRGKVEWRDAALVYVNYVNDVPWPFTHPLA